MTFLYNEYICWCQVCAATAKGKGDKQHIMGTTAEVGKLSPHIFSKCALILLKDMLMYFTWDNL